MGLYRSWVPSMDEGWTRYVFEKEMAVPYQTLHDTDVRAGGLGERFDAIVLPDQSVAGLRDGHAKGVMPDEYTGGLGAEGGRALKAFVEGGGTLVALDSATAYAIEALGLKVKDALAGVDGQGLLLSRLDPRRERRHQRARSRTGCRRRCRCGSKARPPSRPSRAACSRATSRAIRCCPAGCSGGERLRGKASLVEAPLGRGRVVLFGFRPQYRAQSRVSYGALLNALYLSAARP